ncbi:hypothetical protein NFX46_40040 (plasmid) [Streptomyces phaeoluteigriseus]|uniref:Uncharacterized protein n=1 Tax=Streptomyces phaeoluteigriseus TaxID=114686 RepID=A0ABY4ZMF3_9ACTN|nr:hypothetical protein [Streptomyces phaeoluteigriseus]USQ89880.1 hypothetical protein NFX46_40040 [Streptomyces phaeoluteigriseus]
MQTLASGPDWWTIGTNICVATATFAAVVVALWVAIRDGRRQDKDRLERESSQAKLVTCDAQNFPRVVITNHSGLPVLDVRLVKLEIGLARRFWYVEGSSGTLGAETSWVWVAPQDLVSDLDLEIYLVSGFKPTMTIRITDASGSQWFREGSNQPEPSSAF